MKAVIGVYNLASLTTMLGLVCGVLACWLGLSGQPQLAVVALIWAGIFDLFDGMVARRLVLNVEAQEFGVQFDTIVDMASFGIAPVVVAYSLGVSGGMALLAFLFYAVCAAQRLAYFNIEQNAAKGTLSSYTGLPVTFAALIFGICFASKAVLLPSQFQLAMTGLFFIVGGLFISRFSIPKPKRLIYIGMPLLAVFFTAYWANLAIQG